MAESRNYFHGYSRSKDFIQTLQTCFESSTCPSRPWTIKDFGAGTNIPTMTHHNSGYGPRYQINNGYTHSPYFVLSHQNIDGTTGNVLFYDTYIDDTNESYGEVRIMYFPDDLCNTGQDVFNCKTNIASNTHQDLTYHTNVLADVPWLPQHVWYWLWVDDDCFFLRVKGNIGGEGSANSGASWYFIGNADLRPDDDSGIEGFEKSLTIMGPRGYFTEKDTLGSYVNRIFGPAYWSALDKNYADTPTMLTMGTTLSPLGQPTINPDVSDRLSKLEDGDSSSNNYMFLGTNRRAHVSSGSTLSFEYTFAERTVVDQYYLYFNATSYSTGMTSWECEASNDDGASSELLHSIPAAPSHVRELFKFYNITPYSKYRVKITAPSTYSYTRIYYYMLSLGNLTNKAVVHNISKIILKSTGTYIVSNRSYDEYPWEMVDAPIMLIAPNRDIMRESDFVTYPDNAVTYSYHGSLLMKRIEGPSALSAEYSGGNVVLNWTNPDKMAGVRVVRSESMLYMKKSDDGSILRDDSTPNPGADSYTDSSVVSGHTYNYAIIVYDSEGNESIPHVPSLAQITIP